MPKANSGEHLNENCAASGFQLPSEELGFLEEKAEYERRAGLEICLRRIARQGLQYLGRSKGTKSVNSKSSNCYAVVVGAGPYGLSSAAYLRAAGVETRVFGEPMAFWENQMPAGMCLRSNWGASHIADPKQELTLDAYCRQKGNHISKPIPLDRFVDYGRWYQSQAVPDLEKRNVRSIDLDARGFKVVMADGEEFTSRRVVVAAGISPFASSACGVRRHSFDPGFAYERAQRSP